MAQNPRHSPWRQALSLVQCCLTGAGLPGGVPINGVGASPAMTGEVTSGQLREAACCR